MGPLSHLESKTVVTVYIPKDDDVFTLVCLFTGGGDGGGGTPVLVPAEGGELKGVGQGGAGSTGTPVLVLAGRGGGGGGNIGISESSQICWDVA